MLFSVICAKTFQRLHFLRYHGCKLSFDYIRINGNKLMKSDFLRLTRQVVSSPVITHKNFSKTITNGQKENQNRGN
jgi:hypothetical protein